MSYVHSVTNDVATGFSTAFSIAPIYPLYLRDSNGNIMQDRNGKCTISVILAPDRFTDLILLN